MVVLLYLSHTLQPLQYETLCAFSHRPAQAVTRVSASHQLLSLVALHRLAHAPYLPFPFRRTAGDLHRHH
jgi:hypothetical protein